MQDLKSAIPGYPNQCFNGVSSATSATQGTPFIIEMCSNTGNYAWQVTPTGTVTSATVNLMGSLDGVNWYQLDTMNQGDTAGAANGISYTGWNSTSGELPGEPIVRTIL